MEESTIYSRINTPYPNHELLFYAEHNFYMLCIHITLMEYRYASTIEETCRLLERGFMLIAGGTEVNLKHKAERLVDINGLGLDYVEDRGDRIAIGSTARIAQIEASELLEEHKALKMAAMRFTTSVRHLATIGGNIAESVPSADTAPPLLVFDAEAVTSSLNGERTVPVESLFKGLRRNSLNKGEMIKEFLLPRFEGRSIFRKVGRTDEDLAVTSMAISISKETKIALGSAAEVPMRARKAEEALAYSIEKACGALLSETKPVSNIEASKDYRKKLEVELLKECLREVNA